MADKSPSKVDQVAALRIARAEAKSDPRAGAEPLSAKTPLTNRTPKSTGDVVGRTGGSIPPTGAKFDRNAYQREYMRGYRQRKKEQAR